MRYDFRKKWADNEWAETADGKVRRASPRLAQFVGRRVGDALAWCRLQGYRAYVSEQAGGTVKRLENEL